MGEVYYSPPTVTHLKKQGGNIIQNCDIYIGNAVRNSSWDLEESKWCDPFHQRWDLSLKERRKKYRGYVTSKPELMRSLSELRGKMLGCLCQSPRSCHGHVLVELVRKAFGQEEDHRTKASKGNIYYFKGSFSPLSNFYPAVLVDGPPHQRKKFRLGSFQLYYWEKAVNTGAMRIAEALRKAKSVKKVREWTRKIPIVETPLSDQILSMHRILSLKYAQTPAVRQALQRLVLTNRVPAKATSNGFWGCGVDMQAVKRNSPEELFSNRIDGKNYLGWILALIHAEKTGNFYWLPLLKKLPPSMVEGFEEVKNIFAEKGLTRCPPISRSDLEDGARSASSSSSSSSASTSGGGETVDPAGRIDDGPRPEGFTNPSDGGDQQRLHSL